MNKLKISHMFLLFSCSEDVKQLFHVCLKNSTLYLWRERWSLSTPLLQFASTAKQSL